MDDKSPGDNFLNSGISAQAGNVANAVPQQIKILKAQPSTVVIQSNVIAKPVSSTLSVSLAVANMGTSSANSIVSVPGSVPSGVRLVSMQNLLHVQAPGGAAVSTAAAVVTSNQLGQSSVVKLSSDGSTQVTPIQRGNLIIGNRIVQCIVSNASAVVPHSTVDSVIVGQNQINSNSNVQLKLIQPVQSNDGSLGQAASAGTTNVTSLVRAQTPSNIRMSAVLTPGLVRTLLAANASPNVGLQPCVVSSTSQQQLQQRLQSLQPGAVSVQIVRPSVSIQASSALQAVSIQSTPSVLGTATSSNLNIRLPNSVMPILANAPQKKIVLVANTSGTTGSANITYLTTNAGHLQNKASQQLPVTLLASPNSGTGNVRYIAIRGGVPLQLNSASAAVAASSVGTRVVGPSINAAVVNQTVLTSSATSTGSIVQQVVQGSKIDIQDYLRKLKEQQSSKSSVQVASSKSLQVIQPTQLQSTSFGGVKAGTSVQMIGSQQGGSQATTIYIITNNNATSTLTAVSGSGPQQLVQTKALTLSSGQGTAAIRPKVVTVGQGGRTIQVVARDSSASVVPVFVDGQSVKLTKAQQNQKKANKIVAEAIAKAQAEGKDLETCDVDGKRKRKRKADGVSEDDPSTPKKSRAARPKGARSVNKGGKKGDSSGSADEGESEVGTENEKSKDKSKSSKRPPKKKKRPLPTFLKNKKKRKTKDDSDASDIDLGTPSALLFDGDDSLQMRRSSRVVKRKKYVDDLDLNLSDDNSNDDEKPDQAITADECDRLATPSLSADVYEEYPAEEDAQIVEKILGMRIGRRKVAPHPTHAANQKIEAADMDVDVDVERHDERKFLDRRSNSIETVKEIEVEEFYVKYKNYSYLHCEWRTADELLAGDKRIPMKIKRFKLKKAHSPFFSDVDEEDLFNPDYIEIDRILDVAVTVDSVSNETVTHYLVTWRSLAYEDATWELEQDVEQNKINNFLKIRDPPSEEQSRYKQRPSPKDWKALTEFLEYKNSNTLREYQLEGLNWLSFSYYNRQNCILADEMGLGKTIQSITFLHQVFEYGIRGPFLIVVPLSTVGNWQREFEAWTDINVIVYHGSMASRNMLRKYEMYYLDDKGKNRTDVYKFHALITTYEVIISDFDELSQIDWRVAVIDEAHRLKNRNCKLLQGLTCFELEHRLLLTGTPLQNNVDELFSLLSFLEPRQFSSSEAFMAEFGKLETESQVDKLKALLKPMMLRRLKEDVEKSLAPKEETIVEVELTNIQKKYYRAILERNFSFLAKGGTSVNIPNLMNTMMELRKCCNHPYLINGAEDQILEELNVTRGETEKLFLTMIQASGKLVLVDKLLPKLKADGHKVLIFSQMIRVLDIIEDYLLHQHYAYERIDGRIRGNLRQEAIDRFSKPDSDRFVFLLCTRAGGLGINLTAADTVIIFDSDWNPQNDLQAQARCHRIGQMKAVKVYRLITRNTYEREMFDRASLKLGLDKAVLQSMGNKEVSVQNQLSKKEIEDLLKKGAYGALMDDDNAAEEFCEEDIDHILQRRTRVIQIEAGVKGSTFAKASFNMSSNRSDINIDDPNFWQKWAKKVDLDLDEAMNRNDLIMDVPRQRKVTSRYGKQDNIVNMSELDTSNSDTDDEDNPAGGRRLGKRKKRGKSSKDHYMGKVKCYTRSDCFKVEKNLLVYGWGRWQDILVHGRFKHKLGIQDVITITRAMLMFSLQHYEGDERIKKFIYDLISPSEDGKEKDYKNHMGLSAPVPRGRKGKKVKKDVLKKAQFDEDLTKLDIDVDSILIDEGYKKHLKRQSNKVLLRVRLLYYLKQEVIGRQADKIFSGAYAGEIDVPILCADVDIPVYWWDAEADRCLLVGVFKHGYEKYNQMRQDPKLCFLSRCGPPDGKALLAEQNDDDDMKDDDDEDEAKPRRRGRKKKHKKSKKQSNCEDLDDSSITELNLSPSKAGEVSENGKLPFPSASDLNTRFRRVITSYQRSHKQGMLKLEQVAKKMHRREQMKEGALISEQYIDSADLQSMHLEGVGGNPLLLAEQLNWTRREEADFYRVVSTFGVERDCSTGQFIWDNFRNFGRLERKLDDTLTEYFKAFYHMCMKVCDRFRTEAEARQPNGLYVMPITAERANRCLARIDLLSKIREQILFHPRLDERLSFCQPSSYLPDWWICGMHDKDLLVGAAKHGVSRTDYYIQQDPHLSFHKYAQMYAEQNAKESEANKAVSESCPGSPQALKKPDDGLDQCKVEPETNSEIQDISKEEHFLAVQTKVEPHEEKLESQPNKTSEIIAKADSDVVGDFKEDILAEGSETGPNDSLKDLGTNEDEENVAAVARSFNNLWPKDRIIFHRLENICYCVENGKWKISQRHHSNSQLQMLDSSCNTPSIGMSMPGTPIGGGHDYTIVPDSQVDGFKFKLQKRRRRRTKAEIEAGRGDERLIEDDSDIRQEANSSYVKKKRARKIPLDVLLDANDDQDIHIPVVNQLDGSRLSGDEAPTLRDLSMWLDEHPDYVIEKQLIDKNSHSEGGFSQRQHRRPRLDPSKLSFEDITGDENVAVVNRNTGKRITGAKAPTLRYLGSWLVRNPGFDIDPKWAHIVGQMGNLPEELSSRFAVSPAQSKAISMVSDMKNEELYKNMYMAQLAAMSEHPALGLTVKGLPGIEPGRSLYTCNLAQMGLIPAAGDEDSTSESRDSSSPKPSTSAFIIPSSVQQQQLQESGFPFICNPALIGQIREGLSGGEAGRRQVAQLTALQAAYLVEQQRRQNPASATNSDHCSSSEMAQASGVLSLGGVTGPRLAEQTQLRLKGITCDATSLGGYIDGDQLMLSSQEDVWESDFGSRLKTPHEGALAPASHETYDDSSESSDDESGDD